MRGVMDSRGCLLDSKQGMVDACSESYGNVYHSRKKTAFLPSESKDRANLPEISGRSSSSIEAGVEEQIG